MSLPIRRSTEVLQEHMPIAGNQVLDVGCGRGALVGWLNDHGAQAIGLDPQSYLLQPPAIAALGDALPIRDKCFDTVLFFNSLHHVPVPLMERALDEAARVARERVIIVEPIAQGSHFLTVQPVDDETEIRAAAYAALQSSERLTLQAESLWQLDYIETGLEALIAAMIRVDPARREKIAQVHEELERRFYHYGRQTDRGYAFDQPMRLNRLQPR